MKRWVVAAVAAVVAAGMVLAGLSAAGLLVHSNAPSTTGPSLPPGRYLARFNESGLPNGCVWSVVLTNGTFSQSPAQSPSIVYASTNLTALSFGLTSGTYDFGFFGWPWCVPL